MVPDRNGNRPSHNRTTSRRLRQQSRYTWHRQRRVVPLQMLLKASQVLEPSLVLRPLHLVLAVLALIHVRVLVAVGTPYPRQPVAGDGSDVVSDGYGREDDRFGFACFGA